VDPAVLIRAAIVISVMLIVIALGLRYATSEAGYLLRRPGLLVRSLVAMNVVMPVLAVWVVSSFDLRTPVEVALVALAVSPLPPLLPGKQLKLTSEGYVYGIVAAAAVCSVILIPATMAILAAHFHTRLVSVERVVLTVLITVLAPLAIGVFIRRLRPASAERLAVRLRKAGMALLIAGSIPVLVIVWPSILALIGDGTLVAAIALSALGLLVGHLMGGPDPQCRTVLALATASRHPGVALVVGGASFQAQRLVTGAVLLAFIVSMIVAAPYAAWRKRVHTAIASSSATSSR
jgi:bile acid:Na+ symporter, BASS family